MSDVDIWLVWMRDGEWGDTNLMDPAHRTREAAKAWCNENRKLEHGDPISWTVHGGSDAEEHGESRHAVLDRTTRHYFLQVMELK